MTLLTISVVITTYNRAELLSRAIESAIAQTYDNFDVHIVDDCSSDNTPDIIKSIIPAERTIITGVTTRRWGLRRRGIPVSHDQAANI